MNKQSVSDRLNSPTQPHYNDPKEIRGRKLQKQDYFLCVNKALPYCSNYINEKIEWINGGNLDIEKQVLARV